MKVLFATTNPAKVKKFEADLKKKDIELITLKDLGINLHVDENGKNSIENALIKAKAYYEKTGIISIGMDNSLFLEGIPEEKQPGTHVRRVDGKELTDEEAIDYYSGLVKEYGGKIVAKWVYGMVVYGKNGAKEYTWNKSDFYFVDTPSDMRNPGYPLDSIAIIPEFNKYLVELTEDEKHSTKREDSSKENKVVEFIVNSVLENQ